MAWYALEWNRDLMLPALKIREFEQHFDKIIPGPCTVSWEELRRGRVGLMIATLLPRFHRKDKPLTFPQSREAAYGMSMGQLAYYRAMVARGVLREISDKSALESHVAEWTALPPGGPEVGKPPLGFILSMEGSPPILDPEQIEDWYKAGLRLLGPAHYGPSPYCFGTGSEGGFNDDGKKLLREMERVGMLLDVTHSRTDPPRFRHRSGLRQLDDQTRLEDWCFGSFDRQAGRYPRSHRSHLSACW